MQQYYQSDPDHCPQRHQHFEPDVFGLMTEECHAEPASGSPTDSGEPQQRPLRDATVTLLFREGLIEGIEEHSYGVDGDEIDDKREREMKWGFKHDSMMIEKFMFYEEVTQTVTPFFALEQHLQVIVKTSTHNIILEPGF